MLITRVHRQTIDHHPVKNFDLNARHWRRASRGDCAAGYLILGSAAKPHGVDLYWRGKSLKRALISEPLDAFLKANPLRWRPEQAVEVNSPRAKPGC